MERAGVLVCHFARKPAKVKGKTDGRNAGFGSPPSAKQVRNKSDGDGRWKMKGDTTTFRNLCKMF
jgi:hypothetical protein